ncbi:Integrator complex subunit 9 [Dimargaris verticillata]|uniref:Integrator complex subunit 9 n=1 Tax=Dimargaris verticillata TaxID=2761393 RepID=A0A9W8BCP0_9FUNG|nr:Integrator complex subunit 9 [Dimargaris verticillata]
MLALPFITEYTEFAGQVYFTEAGLVFGRCALEEMLAYQNEPVELGSVASTSTASSIPQTTLPSTVPSLPYTHKDIHRTLEKIQGLRYRESQSPLPSVRVTPYSSGFALGSANWVVEVEGQHLTLLSNASLLTGTHPSEFDWQVVEHADALVVTGDFKDQGPPALPLAQRFGQIASAVVATLKRKGNVLLPCHIMGPMFDILEHIAVALDASGLDQTRMYAISPVADRALLYSNIMGEWMCQGKQALIYLPEAPLTQDELISTRRLQYHAKLADIELKSYQEPCVILAGHPSLGLGAAPLLLQRWGESDRNSVIVTDAETDVYRCWQDMKQRDLVTQSIPRCQVHTIPIDTNLQLHDLVGIVQTTRAKTVVVPSSAEPYLRRHARLGANQLLLTHSYLEPVEWLHAVPQHRTVFLAEQAAQTAPVYHINGKAVVRIQGCLRAERDGLWIKSPPALKQPAAKSKRMLCGQLLIDRLQHGLEKGNQQDRDLSLISVTHPTRNEVVFNVVSTNRNATATISCRNGTTKVVCDSEALRRTLCTRILDTSLLEL